MPYKDPEKQKEYQRQWVATRRAEWFAGKSCVDCGRTEDLELDHLDPTVKASHRIFSWAKERREAELLKCVARCNPCHKDRSIRQRTGELHPLTHLTEADALAIRSSSDSSLEVAERYGISRRQVNRIRSGENWTHLVA